MTYMTLYVEGDECLEAKVFKILPKMLQQISQKTENKGKLLLKNIASNCFKAENNWTYNQRESSLDYSGL